MEVHEYEVGLHKTEIDTPALLIDLDALEYNIRVMSDYSKSVGVGLRPHSKIYKGTPIFAWMQLKAGAIGITASKLSEAEVLAAGGIDDILIANQVVGERKISRLVNLARYTRVKVAVDSLENARALSDAAISIGTKLGVVVEVNIGNNRCGVEPYQSTYEFVQELQKLGGLNFMGIMGYDGHLVFKKDFAERDRLSQEAYRILVDTRDYLVERGIPVEIVSGSGSATYQSACKIKGLTELQVGTYIFNDTTYRDIGLDHFQCTLTILATIISRPDRAGSEDVAILDVGRKALDLTYGFPEVKFPEGKIFSMPQEHSRLRFEGKGPFLKVGDKVELLVKDSNGTVNLYDKVYGIRGDRVEAVWDITGRGKVT